MSRFRDMTNEAMQFGQQADLSQLTQRFNQLEARVEALSSEVQRLTARLEKLEGASDQPKE
jgi:prefoldin subunit 5